MGKSNLRDEKLRDFKLGHGHPFRLALHDAVQPRIYQSPSPNL